MFTGFYFKNSLIITKLEKKDNVYQISGNYYQPGARLEILRKEETLKFRECDRLRDEQIRKNISKYTCQSKLNALFNRILKILFNLHKDFAIINHKVAINPRAISVVLFSYPIYKPLSKWPAFMTHVESKDQP